ncbi:MAG: PspA-associated protein PspAB [Chloroflexota bacterium]
MSFLDALLGRTKLTPSNFDQLIGIATANISLEAQLGLKPSGCAAISFRPVSSGDFAAVEKEIDQLLAGSQAEEHLTWTSSQDAYGYRWITLHAPDFDNLAAEMHMLSSELEDHGYGEQLLSAVFQFRDEAGHDVLWVYNYKRGRWYPFVPSGNRQRDNATELRLSAVMKPEMKIEPEMANWYPIWDAPLG